MKDHHPLLVEAGVPGARRRAKSGPLPDSAKLRGGKRQCACGTYLARDRPSDEILCSACELSDASPSESRARW